MKIFNMMVYTILAIALGCALTTCQNDEARKEYEKKQSVPKIEVPSIIEIQEDNLDKQIEDNLDKQIEEITKHR